jgi:hypothetical protein
MPVRADWGRVLGPLARAPAVSPDHPLGCDRQRVSDRVVFEHVVAALVHGSGHERIASPGCSDRPIRRRLQEWAVAGLAETLHTLVLKQDARMIGLQVDEVAVAGCIGWGSGPRPG